MAESRCVLESDGISELSAHDDMLAVNNELKCYMVKHIFSACENWG